MKKSLQFLLSFRFLSMTVLLLALNTSSVFAAEPARIRITDPGQAQMVVALATPSGNAPQAAAFLQHVKRNLNLVPFFQTVDGSSIPGGGSIPASGEGVDFRGFALVGAKLLISSHWPDANHVELRVFDVDSGMHLVGNRYTVQDKATLEDMADTFSDDLVGTVIGKSTLFRSKIAFVKTDGARKRDLWVVKVNGSGLERLSNIRGEALSPSWSFDNKQIVFSHISARSHGLGVWSSAAKTTQRIKFAGSTVIAPCFFPDNRVAVSLTDGRNSSIFMLNSMFQKGGRLEGSGGIDVSPSVDGAGRRMVFTSSRLGNPHVFMKDLQSGSVYRISQAGSYNSDPAISADGSAVVFARQASGGHKLFVYDLRTNQERQITFGSGSDEAPEFSSDGYFIAFMSNKNGRRQLFLTTRDGATPKLIPTGSGDAQMPAWSKVLR